MSSPGSPRQDYDQALKHLLLRAHDDFLAVVAPGLTWRGERNPELPEAKRQADIVWEVEQPGGQAGILHIELQTKPEADIGERMAHYGLRLFARHRLPVLSVVVFLRKAANVPRSPFVLEWMGQERLRYEFEVIRLWELAPERVLGQDAYFLWPLAALMGPTTSAERTIEIGVRIAEAPLDRPDRGELVGLLVLLASLRVPREKLVDVLRRTKMLNDLIKESSFREVMYDLGFGEGEAKGRQEGEAKGRQEGEAKGRQEGEAAGLRESIQAVLAARFGQIDPALLQAIGRLDIPRLKELVSVCASSSLAEIRAWLENA